MHFRTKNKIIVSFSSSKDKRKVQIYLETVRCFFFKYRKLKTRLMSLRQE